MCLFTLRHYNLGKQIPKLRSFCSGARSVVRCCIILDGRNIACHFHELPWSSQKKWFWITVLVLVSFAWEKRIWFLQYDLCMSSMATCSLIHWRTSQSWVCILFLAQGFVSWPVPSGGQLAWKKTDDRIARKAKLF